MESDSSLLRRHTEHFGRLDVLVNSAGIGGAESSATADSARVDTQLAVNLRGPLLVTREALPLLLATWCLVPEIVLNRRGAVT